MDQVRRDCKIPTFMVPRCPVCGGPMDMNLRKMIILFRTVPGMRQSDASVILSPDPWTGSRDKCGYGGEYK
ncbi:hypothetical protein NE628_03800 [Coprococcus eutactus]|nr:hypothetical protein [Coprococcus eutactus]MCG4789504.1 hypothetical protein [Coprococcus eutactus]MCQ5135367.1 hypothetical protein [Coprococcus eutactus]